MLVHSQTVPDIRLQGRIVRCSHKHVVGRIYPLCSVPAAVLYCSGSQWETPSTLVTVLLTPISVFPHGLVRWVTVVVVVTAGHQPHNQRHCYTAFNKYSKCPRLVKIVRLGPWVITKPVQFTSTVWAAAGHGVNLLLTCIAYTTHSVVP